MQFLRDIFYIFYPNLCVTCSKNLLQNESIICIECRHDLPIIDITDYQKNEIASTFYGRIPIKNVASFLYFRKIGKTRDLIHQLKYKGNQEIGRFLGDWYGYQLKESGQFNDVDFVIPVPLHSERLKKRGYNQVTKFAKSISIQLQTEYKPNVLLRISSSKTQTLQKRFERFTNAKTNFKLTNSTIFEGKHILLIDDVITTGATIESCCSELLKTKNIRISIVTIAYTKRQ